MLQNIYILNKCCSFIDLSMNQFININPFFLVPQKMLSNTIVFNIDKNRKSFLITNNIFGLFLKDHVTQFSFTITGINDIL